MHAGDLYPAISLRGYKPFRPELDPCLERSFVYSHSRGFVPSVCPMLRALPRFSDSTRPPKEIGRVYMGKAATLSPTIRTVHRPMPRCQPAAAPLLIHGFPLRRTLAPYSRALP